MIQPFLKWAGGKRWLASSGLLPVPVAYSRYVEPFLGGGAVFFALLPEKALLSDLNEELILLYQVIRDDPAALYEKMEEHHERHSEKYYYSVRASSPRSEINRAAKFLYLNRTCWNGLYRVNLKGEFNVPIGTKSTVLFEDDDFDAVSSALKSAQIKCADFEGVVDSTVKGDFLFLDPPYTVQHNYNGFLKYNEKIFSWDDQVRLRDAVSRAVNRGVAVVLTNADHSSILELYDGICEYQRVKRASVLAASSTNRGFTTEALFTANIETDVLGDSGVKRGANRKNLTRSGRGRGAASKRAADI